ncbi:hypothetical protein FALBO_8005 [Fusarium albosuccineum]|uniref:C2H2-type domain-containing protein n=1 Tax=Fusarium albosuccineum TaxID=1237068 RepID=A0A8H4L8Q1_9HYPO|nr:hypothetical protein FALBO_8005 [Fusarium albosuccineum]
MDVNNFNAGSEGHKIKQTNLPAHLSRRDSPAGSIDSEDPLARDAPTRSHTQSPVKQQPGLPNAPQGSTTPGGRSKFAVVLTRSPGYWSAFNEVNLTDEDLDGPVISDLTPQGKPRTLSRPVNTLAVPSPSGRSTTVSSNTNSSTTPARGRGRPKGSTKQNGQSHIRPVTAAASRQARQVKPRPPPNGFPKRRGRPPKQPSPPPTAIYHRVDAPFFAFLCEWDGCKAELHNLETLRRHVYIVHGDSAQCLWGKCGRREQPHEFNDDEGFREHVEEDHLVPMSWHVGDGPNNDGDRKKDPPKDEIPDFLKDEHGNQVTPSIRDQEEEDIVTWRKNRRKLKDLLIRMNDNLPDESEGDLIDEDSSR